MVTQNNSLGSPKKLIGPSIAVTKPATRAHFPVWGRVPGDPKTSLPPQTGKPWPGGGKVPTPDEGNQDAKTVNAHTRAVPVTPSGALVHFHVGKA
jgi:hypothetical protein